MQNWEEIQAKLNAVSRKYKIVGGSDWRRPRTRDEMIAHFETDWDKLKNFWAANPKIAAGTNDAFNLMNFNNFADWKNWFMGQHPTNEIVMGEGTVPPQTGGNKPPSQSTSQPVKTTLGYAGQSLGGLASYLKAENLPFGTP